MVCFFFSAGIPCIAAVGIQCPSDFNHETKTVFNTTSVYYGFLGVFKTGKASFSLYLSQYLEYYTDTYPKAYFSVCNCWIWGYQIKINQVIWPVKKWFHSPLFLNKAKGLLYAACPTTLWYNSTCCVLSLSTGRHILDFTVFAHLYATASFYWLLILSSVWFCLHCVFTALQSLLPCIFFVY